MTHAHSLAPGIGKETRALLPVWLACTLVIAAGAVSRDRIVLGLGVLAYGLGSIILGAQSIGHEYAHRTLGLLLSQPSDRRRLLLTKVGVLVPMIATTTALAWTVLFSDYAFYRTGRWPEAHVLVLVPLCALFLAPFLTMLSRSPLAAVVFTIAIPPTLLIAGDLAGAAKYGWGGGASIDSFKFAVYFWGTAALCAIAGISSWQMFMRLEVIEGRGPEIHFPPRDTTTIVESDVAVGRVRHPLWLLVKKELRLQQMTFVIAALYFVGWGALTLIKSFGAELPLIPVGVLTVLYFALLSILIGSLASAEERQYGTLEWHLLLPMSTAQQWAVKVGVALGLAVFLGIGIPGVLGLINASANDLRGASRQVTTLLVLALTASSIYLSSLCTSGVRAMVWAMPVALGTLLYVRIIGDMLSQPMFRPGLRFLARSFRGIQARPTMTGLLLMVLPGLMVLLLWFALVNHRSGERSIRRVAWQILSIAGYLALALLLLFVATFPRSL